MSDCFWRPYDERLLELWREGWSATQIAAVLWTEKRINVSRNAVIGRVHRLRSKMDNNDDLKREERSRQNRRSGKPAASLSAVATKNRSVIPLPPSATAPPTAVTFEQLAEHHCKFPYGDRWPFVFCGQPRLTGTPYCVGHCQQSYNGFSAVVVPPAAHYQLLR